MSKSGKEGYIDEFGKLTDGERRLVLKMSRFNSAVTQASRELAPHILCSYLYELCQTFNQFYESNRVIGDDRERLRLQLVGIYADRLKNGLRLLGIVAPDKL
jgi:arginyl-tRNA synthetase